MWTTLTLCFRLKTTEVLSQFVGVCLISALDAIPSDLKKEILLG